MAPTTEEERAIELADKAVESSQAGKLADAARFLREATSIAPDHPKVKAGWLALKEEEGKSKLLGICRDWVKSQDEDDGEKVLRLVKGQSLSTEEAEQAMEILYEFKGEDDVLDHVTGELLANLGAQMWLAKEVHERPTQIYYELFERGDDSIDGLLKVLLNRSVWMSDEAFLQGHRDTFMLSLAMMMEEALDHPERAMKGIATLLAAHAEHLKGIVDADSFDVILSSLDIRLPNNLRSQATVATVKLFELAPDTAQNLISKFVTSRFQRSTADGLVVAFSAAAAIFPIAVTAAAALFLTEGFISTLPPMVQSKKSQKLEQAALELISSACIDKNCREAVNRHCREWLEDIVATSTDKRRANLAALILVKLGDEQASSSGPQILVPGTVGQDDLISRFKSMVVSNDTVAKPDSVEALAYASLQPKVREGLAGDKEFLKRLTETMRHPEAQKNVLFGGLTIFVNLTAYLPIQSEEEKKIAQLKAYANTQKPTDPSPLLNDTHVTMRCKRVLDSGVMPLLVLTAKKGSPAVLSQTLQILLSLSHEKTNRGTLAQQGAVKLLIQIWDHISTLESTPAGSSAFPSAAKPSAAQSLARILISINPSHVFSTGAALPSTSAIRPLLSLLSPSETSTWQLHAFESLLALTNLASLDMDTQNHIIRSAFDIVCDDLLLSSNELVRRAATELLCNLMASPAGLEKFADGSPRASQRLHILLAMTDVEDAPTRSASGGALAMLLSFDLGVKEVLKQERGVEFLLELCRDESEDIRYRGVVCIRSVVEIGREGIEKVKGSGGVEVMKLVLKEARRQEVLVLGVETLKILLGQ
ncbi:CRO1 protein [Melanomma pulvis-pyrius CBS 109.77]|uniref:CRO1 protein n=1 Tax=Melanomma pulvis-pyrius CBS 109.77 TaxID=1314802 RepID=A0A6A6XQJ6_9PLEO|nr:CRO1 protein [Melanomma pulvis-pyrius CBS 109.77]